MSNPFQMTKPVEPSEIIGRDAEIRRLKNLAYEGNNARLVAPRRYGKTSLLGRVQDDLSNEGWQTVYVDLLGIVTIDDFTARIERAYTEQLRGALAKWFTGLRRTLRPTATVGGGVVPVSGSVDLGNVSAAGLVERLALPVKVYEKTGSRVHIVFDEFQELDTVDGNVDAILRSQIQHQKSAASYVFAGSKLHMMEMMFTDKKRAFYGQAEKVSLEPLDPELLAEYISGRFDDSGKEISTEALEGLLELVKGHPQRSMAAAHTLWDVTDTIATVEEWEIARESLMGAAQDELKATWSELDSSERQSLSAVARGIGPYKRGTTHTRGGGVARALKRLEGKGIIASSGSSRTVLDPLLDEWVRVQR
jgi:hypothetical protein